MFCEKCGKEISNESKFCKFCGANIVVEETTELDKTENQEAIKTQKKEVVEIWDKFAEIYDSKGEERDKFNALSSNEAWELINRIGKNTFEGFIEENKERLNKQPYTVIENLENLFKFAAIGGYWLWTAEHILNKGNSWKLKTIDLDKFIKDWTESLTGLNDFIEKNSSTDLGGAILQYQNFKANSFLENCPTIKELPVEFIDNIKTEVLGKILWGYFIGVAESKYIK
jgi:hypothetical protein